MTERAHRAGVVASRLLAAVTLVFALISASFGQQTPTSGAVAKELTNPERWIATGNMNAPRNGHTATLLANGKVLVVGGGSGGDHTDTELYDPIAGTWSFTGHTKSSWGYGHTATLMSDGTVMVIGGDGVELYDSEKGTWSFKRSTNEWRFGHTATRLADGRVLVAGGSNWDWDGSDRTGNPTAEIYDPSTGAWTMTGSLKQARYDHTATLLRDGRVLVLGGQIYSADFKAIFASTEIYDPAKGTWQSSGSLIVPRLFHTATLLPSGRVLVTGGWMNDYPQNVTPRSIRASELFDPIIGTSIATGELNVGRDSAVTILMGNGEVLVTGGLLWHSTSKPFSYSISDVPSAETYNVTSAHWRSAAEQISPRHGHTATLLYDGRILVAGGTQVARNYYADARLASAELYGAVAPGTIGPSFTGSWFDPSQNGHGLLIEVLPGNYFLAAWFTFNPAGTGQAWFTGVGTYIGNTATIADVIQPSGGRWIPKFDPTRVVNNPWGTLKFTFTDCNHGKVEFASTSAYGTGSMNLVRLTQPAGLTCTPGT